MKQIKSTERSLQHLGICRFLVYACYLVLLCLLLVNAVIFVVMTMTPLAQWQLMDTGTHYQIVSFFGGGLWNLPYHQFPFAPPGDAKEYCLAFLVMAGLTVGLPLLLLLEYGRKIIRTVGKSESPFLPQVALWINRMGRVLICMGCFSELVFQLGMGAIVYRRFYFLTNGKFPLILVGCVLLLLADIFRRGCALQQQADETL